MKKIFLFAFTASALCSSLFTACSEDNLDETSIKKSNMPTITATIGESITPKTAIVEGETVYENGEQFYWLDGDRIMVNFINGSGNFNSQNFTAPYVYTTSVISGVKSKTADLSAPFTLTPPSSGNYSVYAVYSGTIPNFSGFNPELISCDIPFTQTQDGTTTEHIGGNDYMYAIQNNVTVDSNGEATNLKLNFKHLCSLLRFSIKNNSSKILRVTNIRIYRTGSSDNKFYKYADLDYNNGTPTFTADKDALLGNSTEMNLEISDESTILNKPGREIVSGTVFDGYMMIHPTGTYNNSDDKFIVELTLKEPTKSLLNPFNTYKPTLTLNCADHPFLKNGFKSSERYYFKLLITDSNYNNGSLPVN